MTSQIQDFGHTIESTKVKKCILKNNYLEVHILEYGAIIQKLVVLSENKDVVLGYDTLREYENDQLYFGCIVGRVANRIAGGKFKLNDKDFSLACNNPPNLLHGGTCGYNKRIWKGDMINNSYALSYHSPDGDQGFPGSVMITVTYTLKNNTLLIEYLAIAENEETPINLTNHSYFNLNGHGNGTIKEHCLMVNSNFYTPLDSTGIPTGEIRQVEGSCYDLSQGTYLGKRFDKMAAEGLKPEFDDNFVLNDSEIQARLWSASSGIEMDMCTSKPAVQVYTANYMGTDNTPIQGKEDKFYYPKSAICLETQFFPDSVNKPNFPDSILRPGNLYLHDTQYTFNVKKIEK